MRRTVIVSLLIVAAAPAAHAQAPNPEPPEAVTNPTTDVATTAATARGTVDAKGTPTTYRFEYGTSTSYGLTSAEAVTSGTGAEAVSARLTGLTPSTTYNVRLVATNAAGTSRGANRTFTTGATPSAPRVGQASARNLSPTEVELSASVNPSAQETRVRFELGTSRTYGRQTGEVRLAPSSSSTTVRIRVSGLRPYTTYQTRAVATNASGTTRGANRQFRTLRGASGVSIAVPDTKLAFGARTTVSGRVSGSGVGGVPVALERLEGDGRFREIARRNAESDGDYAFSVGPLFASTRLRAVVRATVSPASTPIDLLVRARVGLRPERGARSVLVRGTVFPAVTGARVSVQRQAPSGRWVRVGRTTVRAVAADRGSYRLRVARPRRTAAIRVVVIPATTAPVVRGISREVRIAARR